MTSDQRDNDTEFSEKCGRLEQLLHQALALAGEIAEDEARQRARSNGHLPGGACIIIRNAPGFDDIGAMRHAARHRFSNLGIFPDHGEERQVIQCTSAAPSVQEPFSPGTLAQSLDAIVEGEGSRSDSGSCFLDSGSTTAFASRSPELPSSKTSGLVSIAEAGEDGATERRPSLFQTTATGSPRGRQSLTPPPSRTTSKQTRLSPQPAESPGPLARSASTQSCPLPARHEPSPPLADTTGLTTSTSPSPSPSPGHKGRGDDDTARNGEDHIPPSRWHVRIVPVPSPPSLGAPWSTSPPAFVKLEAVFPCRSSADDGAEPSPAWGGEGSYIIMGRPLADVYPGVSHFQDYGIGSRDVRGEMLQEYVDEWDDYAAEALGLGDARRWTG